MVSINGIQVSIKAFNERVIKGGENVIEYDISTNKWTYQLSNALTLRVWSLVMQESKDTPISSSVYTTLYNAYKNNTTLTFVLNLAFHNLGSFNVKVYSPPSCTYDINDRGAIRLINVELIEIA